MTKLKNINVKKLKNSKSDKTYDVNSNPQNVRELTKKCDRTKKLKVRQNSKTQNLTKL